MARRIKGPDISAFAGWAGVGLSGLDATEGRFLSDGSLFLSVSLLGAPMASTVDMPFNETAHGRRRSGISGGVCVTVKGLLISTFFHSSWTGLVAGESSLTVLVSS